MGYTVRDLKHLATLVTAFALTCGVANAGTISVNGEVRSSLHGNLPIAGAVVEVEGTEIKTVTDDTGAFSLDGVPDKGNLIFTFEDLEPEKKKIKAGKSYKVLMEVYSYYDGEQLVNIGYKSEKRSEVTGSVATLSESDVQNGAAADLNASLSGKVAGMAVSSSAVDLGETPTIQIRGANSIFSGSDPLYVVDGIPYESNPEINPREVKAINVLKDAASCAVYGTRGAGGVILITTIKGAEEAAALEAEQEEAKAKAKAEKRALKKAEKEEAEVE